LRLDVIGHLSRARQAAALLGNAGLDAAAGGLERMTVPGLAESAHQACVARFEIHQLQPRAFGLDQCRGALDGGCRVAGANVDHQRRTAVAFGLLVAQGKEMAEEGGRQVVDDRIAEILEQLAGLALARAREAADHEQMVRGHRFRTRRDDPSVMRRLAPRRCLGRYGARHRPLPA